MAIIAENFLLVEGKDDKRIIPYLMEENGVEWPDEKPPVYIKWMGSYEEIVAPQSILLFYKSSKTKRVGVIVDADDNAPDRWAAIRNRCLSSFPNLPTHLPKGGIISSNESGQRLGVWIMPNNRDSGMIETFLQTLVPDGADNRLWMYACETAETARDVGAPYVMAHLDKARIHNWLAWQDPPGQQLHTAILMKVLSGESDVSMAFVEWFKDLYEIAA